MSWELRTLGSRFFFSGAGLLALDVNEELIALLQVAVPRGVDVAQPVGGQLLADLGGHVPAQHGAGLGDLGHLVDEATGERVRQVRPDDARRELYSSGMAEVKAKLAFGSTVRGGRGEIGLNRGADRPESCKAVLHQFIGRSASFRFLTAGHVRKFIVSISNGQASLQDTPR
jgi:hypothetical protein